MYTRVPYVCRKNNRRKENHMCACVRSAYVGFFLYAQGARRLAFYSYYMLEFNTLCQYVYYVQNDKWN